MAVGIWIHLTERHEHEHPHKEPSPEPPTAHADEDFSQEAPDAKSRRVRPDRDPVRHSHPHYPDSEHRHEHWRLLSSRHSMVTPVTKSASLEARKQMTWAWSSGVATRPRGVRVISAACASGERRSQ